MTQDATASWLFPLVVAGLPILLLAIGGLLRLQSIRRIKGGLALLALAGIAHWVVELAGSERWQLYADVAILLALGYLVIRVLSLITFEWLLAQRMGVTVPVLARDLVTLVLVLLMAAVVLRAVLGIEVGALLATSAVVTVVVGLALQETLGTLLSGLSLAWEKRLATGDWVEVDGIVGEVREMGSRSLLLRTHLGEQVAVPNSQVARARLRLLGDGGEAAAFATDIGVAYDVAPHHVKHVLLGVLEDLPLTVAEPVPQVLVKSFADSAVVYECRVWTRWPWLDGEIRDELLTRAWAALARHGIEIPFPQRTLRFAQPSASGGALQRSRLALSRCELFSGLEGQALELLAAASRPLTFAPGEAVVHEGEASSALYVVARGEAVVLKGRDEIARVHVGDVFGEIAFLSEAPRSATVRAVGGLEVVEVGSEALRALLSEYAGLAEELANRMVSRQREMAAREEVASAAESRPGLARFLLERLQRLVSGVPSP